MPRLLGDGGDAGGQAAGEAGEHHLDGRDAVVLGGEELRVVGVEHERLTVGLLAAERRRSCRSWCGVGAADPLAAGPPLERGSGGRAGHGFPGAQQGFDVHAVVRRVSR